jgi:hypothetical protein
MNDFRRIASNRALAGALVVVAALVYPLIVLAEGSPPFPKRSDCVVSATQDGQIELVFGYFDSVVRATPLRDRVRKVGYVQAEVVSDGGCGRVKVAVDGYTTLAGARDAVGEARGVGLRPTLEQAS